MLETYLLASYILYVLPFVQSEKLITISKSTIIILIWFQVLCVCFCSFAFSFSFSFSISHSSHLVSFTRSLRSVLFLSVFTGFRNDVSPNVWLCHKRKSLNWCSRRIVFSWKSYWRHTSNRNAIEFQIWFHVEFFVRDPHYAWHFSLSLFHPRSKSDAVVTLSIRNSLLLRWSCTFWQWTQDISMENF